MRKTIPILAAFFASIILLSGCTTKPIIKEKPTTNIYERGLIFKNEFVKENKELNLPYGTRVDTVAIDTSNKSIVIRFNQALSYIPFREENVKNIYSVVYDVFKPGFENYSIKILTLNHDIKELIPNFYRNNPAEYDSSRLQVSKSKRDKPVIQNISKKYLPSDGLYTRNIVVWPSHGWYYNNREDRWEWQRPRLFQSVEDLIPYSFVIPFLEPMLENAGANVFIPRERDVQTNEVVIDNDTPPDSSLSRYIEKSVDKEHKWKRGIGSAFAIGNPPYPVDFNPFTSGTHNVAKTDSVVSASFSWIPQIPESGKYAVYVSYSASDANTNDAHYVVYHEGQKTEFAVNQTIGGNTWEYLGTFKFGKGYDSDSNKVVLVNKSDEINKLISADAVRFGGGMANIMRNGHTSGRPRFVEGSRYYLQYMGMPDTLVYNFHHNKNDYTDDYQSRAEYANYLYGNPYGPNKDRTVKGLGIPIDISMAFHTDAGITHNDTTVGTLSIYSLSGADSQQVYPDGISRMANRDLADIMQTEIVNQIRTKFDPVWNRRQLKIGNYSESFRPNFPAVLVELLSHQNFLDMRYVQDPTFRFTVARAMYKAMLKFLSVQYNFKYVVQPLPVKDFSSTFDGSGNVHLDWKPVLDSTEITAKPDHFIVYTRINNGDFDNGIKVDEPSAVIRNIKSGAIYSFKVTALNKGGESFPSEILSVCKMDNDKKPVLIVNGFDRVASPAWINSKDYSGFLNQKDPGMPYQYDVSFTGAEYNFDQNSPYVSNDRPGWGASHANYETKVIAGNTFDYPYVHGEAIKSAGYSFVSTSAASVENGSVNLNNYKFVDLILGEQKSTHWQKPQEDSLNGLRYQAFPETLRNKISAYCNSGGNIFISGAYVGSELFNSPETDSTSIKFGQDILKINWDTDHASVDGNIFAANNNFMPKFTPISFNTSFNKNIYAVKSPDAINNTKESNTLLRYSENQFSAGTGYFDKYGVIVFGFPFETISNESQRNLIMRAIFSYFKM